MGLNTSNTVKSPCYNDIEPTYKAIKNTCMLTKPTYKDTSKYPYTSRLTSKSTSKSISKQTWPHWLLSLHTGTYC